MNELALFAGAGGGILGGYLLGWRTVCAVEVDAYAREVLLSRQRDGSLAPFPIWDDVRTFDGRPWCGCIDIISGGFPCQDISVSGHGKGIDGIQSGLWKEMRRIVHEVRPRFVFVENSPALTFRGLNRVLGDLASLGFDAEWGVLGAHHIGGIHKRERIWILAHANAFTARRELHDGDRVEMGWEGIARLIELRSRQSRIQRWTPHPTWATEPAVGRVVDGLAHRVDRMHCLGNGQIPFVAATAFSVLMSHASESRRSSFNVGSPPT